MSVKRNLMDNPEVGAGGSEFFKPSSQKQVVALIPSFIPLAELNVSDELKEKAKKDADAASEVEELVRFKEMLEQGADRDPATVLKASEPEEGYYYARADSHFTHYMTGVGYYLCKKHEYEKEGRESTCCKFSEREALLRYAVVLLVYDTDAEGEVNFIPKDRAQPLDDKNKLDFKYKFCTWTLTDSQMRAWKQFHKKNPPVSTDYEINTVKQGNADRVNFTPCRGDALWTKRGPVLQKKILKEGAKVWATISKTLGKDLPVTEIDQMFLGSAAKKSGSNERDFKGLIGG